LEHPAPKLQTILQVAAGKFAVQVLELAEKVKEITKCKSTIEFCPMSKVKLDKR